MKKFFYILFAALIGLALSLPVELVWFNDNIQAEIINRQQQKADKERRISEIKVEIADTRVKLAQLQLKVIGELEGAGGTGRQGAGPVFRELQRVYESYQTQSEARINELNQEIRRLESETAPLGTTQDFSLTSRLAVLADIRSTSPTIFGEVWKIRLGLVALFVLAAFIYANYENTPRREPIYDVPTFWSGFASAVDWAGELAPSIEDLRRTTKEPESANLAKAWKVVGGDLQKVLDRYGKRVNRESPEFSFDGNVVRLTKP